MLEQGKQYSASDFIALKAKVKAEMLRRCHTGSLASYGGSEYDFTTTPKAGGQIMVEQINKIIEPMNAINDSGFITSKSGDQAVSISSIYTKLTEYESAALDSDNHHCKASCSGLCSTGCASSCTGDCTNGYGGTCDTGCGNNCQGKCTGSCYALCIDSCETSCLGGCKHNCTIECAATCAVEIGMT